MGSYKPGITVEFDPAKHCGRIRQSTGEPCKNPKGMRTAHKGIGPCWKHGGVKRSGDGRVKHGLESKYLSYAKSASGSLAQRIEQARLVADPHDLTEEIALLRGTTHDFLERFSLFKEALLAFNLSFQPAMKTIVHSKDPQEVAEAVAQLRQAIAMRPSSRLDISNVASLADRLGALVERAHTMKQRTGVPAERVLEYSSRLGMWVLKCLKDKKFGINDQQFAGLAEAIADGFKRIEP